MANLTSTLTLKLTDDVSAPAKQIAASLKGVGVSAAELNRVVKLDALRQAQTSFREAAATFQTTQTSVRKLAQEFAAADTPTKAMTNALARAREQASAAGQTFAQQSTAFRQARMDLQQLGVPLTQVASEEQRLRQVTLSATQAMQQQAAAAQTLGARIRAGAGRAFGTIAPFLGPPILATTYKALKAGAAIDSAQMSLRVAGVSDSEIARVTTIALAQQARYPQLAINEILDRYKEARSVVPNAADAEKMLPMLAQTAAALKALEKGGKVEAGSIQGLGFALKAGQVLGAAQNPERLRTYLEAFLKAKQVKGDLVTPDQIYSFMAGLKGSGALLSDRFLHTTAMSLAAELKGGRAGSGIDAFVKTIVAPLGENAKEFLALGLLRKSDFKPPASHGGFGKSFGHSANRLGEVKLGHHVAGWELAQTDPDKWVAQYLLPALRQKGFTDMPAILALVQKLFPGRSADIVTKLITQAESYKREAEKMREASGAEATEKYKEDALFQLDVLRQAFANFGGVLTSPMMVEAAHAMNWISRTFAEWAKGIGGWNKENPGFAKAIGGIASVSGLGVGGALTYGLIKNLWSGFGLKSSAVALDGSAAALTRAAIVLGGSKALEGVGGIHGVKAAEKSALRTTAGELLKGAGIAGALLTLDNIIYDSLPDDTKAELARREDKINAMKRAGKFSKTELLRQSFNSDRARLGIPLIGSPPETGIPRGGSFRLSAPSAAAPASMPAATGAEPAPVIPPAIGDQSGDAKAAGQAFGGAFRAGVAGEISRAVEDVEKAVKAILNLMTFSASPDVTPRASGVGGGVSPGLHGELSRGQFADYGAAP